MARPRSDFDTAWKEFLTRYFQAFLLFFFPLAYDQVDWRRPVEFLETELRYAIRTAGRGRRTVDVLARVWLKDGTVKWILVHAEIQSQVKEDVASRMFICNTLLHARYKCPVASFAVLGDAKAEWRPSEYGYNVLGTRAEVEFPVMKLLDYQDRWEELEQSTNPFALVVMAHLKTIETARKPESRLQWKNRLLEWLYREGRTPEEMVDLFRFLGLVMTLPERQQQRFEREVQRQEKESTMAVLTQFERHAIEKGMEKGELLGIEKGQKEGALRSVRASTLTVLTVRLGEVPAGIAERVRAVDEMAAAEMLLRLAATAQSLGEFEKGLPPARRSAASSHPAA